MFNFVNICSRVGNVQSTIQRTWVMLQVATAVTSGVTYQRQPQQMPGGPRAPAQRAPKGPTKMVYQICERLVNIECKTLKRVVFTSEMSLE